MGALLPYRRARTLLSEFLPLGKPQTGLLDAKVRKTIGLPAE